MMLSKATSAVATHMLLILNTLGMLKSLADLRDLDRVEG